MIFLLCIVMFRLFYIVDLDYAHTVNWKISGKHRQPLSWERRLKVVMGAAKGLAFLHSLEPCVIYRDFKSSNVLLDSVRFFFPL